MKGGFLILSLVVLAIVSVGIYGCSHTTKQMQKQTQQQTPQAPTRQARLSVSSQTLTGNEIVIDNLYLDKPGYVVIHKDDSGKPGAVIGHSDLIAGERSNVRVTIDASQTGVKVFVMLHYDDDNDGAYGFPDEDKPVVLEGNVVVKAVTIQVQQPAQQQAPQVQAKEFTIDADDNGFYITGNTISEINVDKGDNVKITFNVLAGRVYFGGLDFRSSVTGDTGKINPGSSTTVEFTTDSNFDIKSYWPASNRLKATLDVMVS